MAAICFALQGIVAHIVMRVCSSHILLTVFLSPHPEDCITIPMCVPQMLKEMDDDDDEDQRNPLRLRALSH